MRCVSDFVTTTNIVCAIKGYNSLFLWQSGLGNTHYIRIFKIKFRGFETQFRDKNMNEKFKLIVPIKLSDTQDLVAFLIDGDKSSPRTQVNNDSYRGWTRNGPRLYPWDIARHC